MSNEIEPRLHLAVKVRADAAILARTAGISAVTHPGAGIYRVQYPTAPIAIPEEVHAMETEAHDTGEGITSTWGHCVRISDTEYEIRTFSGNQAAFDAGFSFQMYRVSSSNGT
jgi:hypothetical protein